MAGRLNYTLDKTLDFDMDSIPEASEADFDDADDIDGDTDVEFHDADDAHDLEQTPNQEIDSDKTP